MAGSKGYYSVVQYCPDRSRLEVANVGILLFCPEQHSLEIRMARGNDRIRKIFGVHGESLLLADEAKKELLERIAVEKESIKSISDLDEFIASRGNDILLTPARPIKIQDFSEEVDRLFKELVASRERVQHASNQADIPELDDALKQDALHGKILNRMQVRLPLVGIPLEIPYAFRNGRLNLIKPQRFPAKHTEVLSKASELAFRGSLLFKHPDGDEERELLVVSAFDDPDQAVVSTVDQLFNEYGVRHFHRDQIPALVAEIIRKAHS